MKHLPNWVVADVSRETSERLATFADLLIHWNTRINLVSAGDIEQIWSRHIADSLQLLPDLAAGPGFIDLGSGGGFPGLVLAIATGQPVILIESDRRKASFLREAARATATDAIVLAQRIDDVDLPPSQIVTARALAPLPQLLEWASRLLAPDGICLFLKGRRAASELTAAQTEWHMTVSKRQSRTDPDGVILRLSELRRVREPDRAPGR